MSCNICNTVKTRPRVYYNNVMNWQTFKKLQLFRDGIAFDELDIRVSISF